MPLMLGEHISLMYIGATAVDRPIDNPTHTSNNMSKIIKYITNESIPRKTRAAPNIQSSVLAAVAAAPREQTET